MASNLTRFPLFAPALAIALSLTSAASATTAAERESARQLMATGDAARQSGDLAGAVDAYRKADDLVKVPTTALALGEAELARGRLVEALDALGRARRYPLADDAPDALRAAQERAKRLDVEIAARVPTLQLRVEGVGDDPLRVTLDGEAIGTIFNDTPLRLNPGRHRLEIEADGYAPGTLTVELAERQRVARTLRLKALPAPPSDAPVTHDAPNRRPDAPPPPSSEAATISPWTIASFSLGGAALAVAAVTGGIHLAQTDALRDECGGNQCPPDRAGEGDDLMVLANVSNAFWIIGGLATAAGFTTLASDLSSDGSEISFHPQVGPGSAGLVVGGSF